MGTRKALALVSLLSLSTCTSAEPGARAEQLAAFGLAGDEALHSATRFRSVAGGYEAEHLAIPGTIDGGFEMHVGNERIRVREHGAHGDVRVIEDALVHARSDGASYWTARADGAEEWLHVAGGDDGVRAAYTITGASPELRGKDVVLMGRDGAALVSIRATRAVSASGRAVAVSLAVHGNVVEVVVGDGAGEALLIDPLWTALTPIPIARWGHKAALLADGRVLIVGGEYYGSSPVGPNSSLLFDPKTRSWTSAGAMVEPRVGHTINLLDDGRVIACGGYRVTSGFGIPYCEIWDPVALTWTRRANAVTPRSWHSSVLLPGNRVLITGGQDESSPIANNELYDVATNTWTVAGALAYPRIYGAAALLPSGKVLTVGGHGGTATNTTEFYDPPTNTWSAGPSMTVPRSGHTLTKLPSGKLLVVGGLADTSGKSTLSTHEIYDPSTNAFTSGGTSPLAHWQHAAAPLPDGRVLVAGGLMWGAFGWIAHDKVSVFDPATTTWTATDPMLFKREAHTATALADGKVLVVGGQDGYPPTSTVELYSPPCTTSAQCGGGACVDGYCCDRACAGACEACSAAKKGKGVNGYCEPVAAGSDPDGDCSDDGAPTCLRDGMCDGAGACRYYAAGTICQPATCVSTAATAAGTCTAPGVCTPGVLSACEPFACGISTCRTSCSTDAHCAASGYCAASVCVAKKSNGASCAGDRECVTGHCVDGVCCDTACTEDCHACSTATGAPVDGTCSPLSGPTCDDGNACTTLDTCAAGVCTGGPALVCAAPDACHEVRGCDAKLGCVIANKADGTSCDDGNACTTDDVCTGGNCGGTAKKCAALDQCHSAGVCNPTTGICSDPARPDGSRCDDRNACTDDDQCVAGACRGSPRACPAPEPCRVTRGCSAGACVDEPAPDGTPCASGSCLAGVCEQTASVAPASESNAGCGCETPHGAPPSIAWTVVLAGAAAVAMRRRLGVARASRSRR